MNHSKENYSGSTSFFPPVNEAYLERQPILDYNRSDSLKTKKSKRLRYVGALFCLLALVFCWIAMGEILQQVQSSKHKYRKPFFMVFFIHCAYILQLPVWFIGMCISKRKNKSQVFEKEKASYTKTFIWSNILHILLAVCGYSWYLSLPITSVSANTSIYNSASIFVFILSIFILKEKITILKSASVFVCVAGVIMVSVFGSQKKEKGEDNKISGYILVIVSTILYALYEVLYKKVSSICKRTSILDSLLFVGMMGIGNILFLWPFVIILHYTGVETFELPNHEQLLALSLTAVLESLFSAFLLVGILLTSPLLMSVGSILTIPTSVVADVILHSYLLPPLAFVGIGLIICGFVGINVAEYLHLKQNDNEEEE